MSEPDDTMTSERRVAEQADRIVADDVARSAATGRLKKRVRPRRLHPFLPPGSAGVGCLLVFFLLVGTGLTSALTGCEAPPATPRPIVTPTPTITPTAPGATPTPSETQTATASATPTSGGGPILTDPDPIGDALTGSDPVDDPEVDIVEVSIQKIGDAYRVTVKLASGLTHTYSFAVVLDIGHETGPPFFIESTAVFIWQTHGLPVPELLIGRIDPKTSELIAGEAEGVHITFDQASGTVVFEFAAEHLPADADRLRVISFHRLDADQKGTNQDVTSVITFGGIICGGTCQR
jgi:hypothetical protein